MIKTASYYHLNQNNLICDLCPHCCNIPDQHFGVCGVRQRIGKQLITHNYGEISALNLDPVEKKPLEHFMKGSYTLSIGSYGCNFHCDFCQNYTIAILEPKTDYIAPERLIKLCLEHQMPSISFTYNEPTVYYEYVYDVAQLAHAHHIKTILVTNGYINKAPLKALAPYIDAVNIDYKATDDEGYKSRCGGNQKVIQQSIEILEDCHIELSFLIVPGLNSDLKGLESVFKRLAVINPKLVIHINRYFPQYQMKEPATDLSLLVQIKAVALQYFQFVYIGNV